MNVILSILIMLPFGLSFLNPGTFHKMPKLRVIDRIIAFKQQRQQSPSTRRTQHTPNNDYGNEFLSEYFHKNTPKAPTATPTVPDGDLNFESEEISEAVDFIEFKMSEINALIKECINEQFQKNKMADSQRVKIDCAGNSFQILIYSYREGMRRVKDVLIGLIKVKLPMSSEGFNEEISFFVDLIEQLVDSDFKMEETLKVAKKASKYYVSPRIFDQIIENAQSEIMAFGAIQERLRGARNEVQKELDDRSAGEEELVRKLQLTDNSNTRKWKKKEIFGKLENKAEFVGDYLERPVSGKTRAIQDEVDGFLKSREGGDLLVDLMGSEGNISN